MTEITYNKTCKSRQVIVLLNKSLMTNIMDVSTPIDVTALIEMMWIGLGALLIFLFVNAVKIVP